MTVPVALFCLLLMTAIISVTFVGGQQELPLKLAMLHLNDCELPCWIGITPGRTSAAEAAKIIAQVYGPNTSYLLQTSDTLQYKVLHKTSPYTLGIALRTDSDAAIISQIVLLPKRSSDSGEYLVTVGDLYTAFGDNPQLRISSWIDFPALVMLDQQRQMRVYMDNLKCSKVRVHQEIVQIIIGPTSTNSFAWLSEHQDWRGFGRCNRFES